MYPKKSIKKKQKGDKENIHDRRKVLDKNKTEIKSNLENAISEIESGETEKAIKSLIDAIRETNHISTGDDMFEVDN